MQRGFRPEPLRVAGEAVTEATLAVGPTNIRDRRIGDAMTLSGSGEDVAVNADIQAVVRRLLLFDTYVMTSHRLLEVPRLVSTFGSSGVATLLQSGALRLTCEALSVCDARKVGAPTRTDSQAVLCKPLVIQSADPEKYISDALQVVHTVAGIAHKDAKRLKLAIIEGLERSPPGAGTAALEALREDVKRPAVLSHFVALAARLVCGVSLDSSRISISARLSEDGTFHLESNLLTLGIADVDVDKVLQKTILAMADLNYRLEQMKNFSAISGVIADEGIDLICRLGFLMPTIDPERTERQFDRTIEIVGLPEIEERQFVDAEKILKIRDTAECRAFRVWLKRADNLADAEIADLVGGLRSKIASAFQSKVGRTLRFVATSAVGTMDTGLGIAIGALDQFLLDRVLREPGPVAFLNRLYPSIFPPSL
jgi:hypothetical protein